MNKDYEVVLAPFGGGIMWKGDDLAGIDAGFSIMKQFIEENPHKEWLLSIFDSLTQSSIEIDCNINEMPDIVAYIYQLEHASPMYFIGENWISESYVVGMNCTRGRLNIPGIYVAKSGKLIDRMIL